MSQPGMWMPKQKDGLNWSVGFSFQIVGGERDGQNSGELSKKFRVRKNAIAFIAGLKNLSVEAGQVKHPELSNLKYSQPQRLKQ